MSTAFAYIVTLQATHPRDGTVTDYTLHLDAYTIQDAMYQAMFELDAKHALIEQQYKLKVLSVGPDTEKATDRLRELMSEIGLLRMPSRGGKS